MAGVMEITHIPYAQTIGLEKGKDGILRLNNDESLHNHVQTIAAAAQFSLAELASGEHLLTLFPELVEQVVPILRDSRLKYKKPATSTISAHASVREKSVSKFTRQLDKKGRALITVKVEIRDHNGVVTSSGLTTWWH
jgi:acyl-coenzyme A thioesterase PaaI-like protein